MIKVKIPLEPPRDLYLDEEVDEVDDDLDVDVDLDEEVDLDEDVDLDEEVDEYNPE